MTPFNNKIKGFAKVEKFEAKLNENNEWEIVGEVLDSTEGENDLNPSRYLASFHGRSSEHSFYYYLGYVYRLNTPRNTSNASEEAFVWISELPTIKGAFAPMSGRETFTQVAYNSSHESALNGDHVETNYQYIDKNNIRVITKYRFNPKPGYTRPIRSIGLRHITALPLESDFLQSPTQIVDVTYTLDINIPNSDQMFSRVNDHITAQMAYPTRTSSLPSIKSGVLLPQKIKHGSSLFLDAEFVNSTDVQSLENNFGMLIQREISVKGTSDYVSNNEVSWNDLGFTDGVSYHTSVTLDSPEENVGALIGSMLGVDSYGYKVSEHEREREDSIYRSDKSDMDLIINETPISPVSAVQNIFPRSAGSNKPYQDVDHLATGGGTVEISDSEGWSGSKVGFAEKYRINITSSGGVGTSTYNLMRRSWYGTNENTTDATYAPHLYMQRTIGSTLIPSEDGVSRQYHGQHPWDLSRNSQDQADHENNKVSASKRLNDEEFITYDHTGITIMPINDLGMNFETNFVNISQVEVDYHNSGCIFVADKVTGLWKIDRTVGQDESQSTITQLVPANVADSSTCRGVQIKNDGTIWAIFGEELCSSSDGTSWVVYNATSATQFKIEGYLDTSSESSSPSNVNGFIMDRVNSEDRFLIPVDFGNRSVSARWWSREGSSAGTSDASNMSTSGMSSSTYGFNKGFAQNVHCTTGGVWIICSSSYSQEVMALNFKGSTRRQGTLTHAQGTAIAMPGQRINSIIDDDGEEWILGSTIKAGHFDHSHYASPTWVKSSDITPEKNTSNQSMIGYLPGTERTDSQYRNTFVGIEYVRCSDFGISAAAKSTTSNWLTTRKIQGSTDDSYINGFYCTVNSGCVIHCNKEGGWSIHGMYGDENASSSSHPIFWKKLGWDGSNWVEGSTDSKPTHSNEETFLDGLKISFTGSEPESFVSSEYYDAYVFDGILKDNATTVSFEVTGEWLPKFTISEFGSGVIPASVTETVTEKVNVGMGSSDMNSNTSGSSGAVALFDKNTWHFGGIYGYDSYGISQQIFSGDFEVSFKMSPASVIDSDGVYIGMMPVSDNKNIDWEGHIRNYGWCINLPRGGRSGSNYRYEDLELQFKKNDSTRTTMQLNDFNKEDVFKITRVDGKISYFRNDILLYEDPTSSQENIQFAIVIDGRAGSFVLSDIVATYEKSGSYLTVGNGVDSGYEDPEFRKIVSHSRIREKYNDLFIDGSPAVLSYGYGEPSAGECLIMPHSGELKFSNDDAGKSVTGQLGYVKKF